MLNEAGAVVAESEKPLGYVATLITILGGSALIAYLLTLAHVGTADAIVIGALVGVLALLSYYLAIAIRRSARAHARLSTTESDVARRDLRITSVETENRTLRDGRDAKVTELQRLLDEARDNARRERERLEETIRDRENAQANAVRELMDTQRELEVEKQNTERAKVAPAMDPYYRVETPLLGKARYFVGVVNRGFGPAEDVTLSLAFKDARTSWPGNNQPYAAVVDKGSTFEVALDSTHFDRNPARLEITVDYDDLARAHHRKGVVYTF